LDVIVDSQGTKTTLHLQHIMDSYSRWPDITGQE
jgi:hypothetical protein